MGYMGFKKLKKKVGGRLAAWIGRRKYGKKRFASYARRGKKMRNARRRR